MNRRQFIQTTAMAAASSGLVSCATHETAEHDKRAHWPIGCFNRPWAGDKRNWGYDAALDGIKAAGYKLTGLLTRTAKEPLIGADASPEHVVELKQKIAQRGLNPIMAA